MLTNAFTTPASLALTALYVAPADTTCFADVTATIATADATVVKDTISIAVKLADGSYKYLEYDRELVRGVSFSFEKIILLPGHELTVKSTSGKSDFIAFISQATTTAGVPV